MIAEHYLQTACKRLAVVNRIIREYGELSLADYLKTLTPNSSSSYQSRDDFFDAVFRYASPLLGENIAEQAVSDLKAFPMILTSNHLGVEYFSQSLQSSILFSLRSPAKTVPVFSFGNIPLNNLTYPRGVLLYDVGSDKYDNMPLKIPVFPDRFKRCIASAASGFNKDMIRKVHQQIFTLLNHREISSAISDTIQQIFQHCYTPDNVIGLSDYSRQCAVSNTLIWKRLFLYNASIPELIYLEIEKIVSDILKQDLSDSKTLMSYVLSDSELRRHILEELNGIKGCWNRQALEQRIADKSRYRKHCGTMFFWGIDASGRRIPFYLDAECKKNIVLRGVDDSGNEKMLKFDPDTIIHELHEKRLIPSLFTCFLTLSYARGIICVGGYFQAEYLPNMQSGLVRSLRKSGYTEIARCVSRVPADAYLSGMLAIMRQTEDRYLIPASTIEIIAGGGITDKDIEKIGSLTVRDAHIAGLFETAPDAVLSDTMPAGWKKELAEDCYKLLKEKVVVK